MDGYLDLPNNFSLLKKNYFFFLSLQVPLCDSFVQNYYNSKLHVNINYNLFEYRSA